KGLSNIKHILRQALRRYNTKELFERTHLYIQYNGSTEDNIAELDSQSVLARSTNKIPPALVLARDIRYSTSIRSKAILSLVGTIKPEWVEHPIKRQLKINNEEKVRLNSNNIISKFSMEYT
ncbi:unnamed protein product, partial [Rotaria sordida]